MQLAEIQTNKTMSSREIATLCEKEHKNVIRDIRNMLDSLDDSLLSHEYYQILTDERRAVIARPHSVIVQNIANNRSFL